MAEFKDIERAELASYPESSHAHSFILHFFDKSSITLAAKSFGGLSTRQPLPLHPASSSYALPLLLLSVFVRPLLTWLACQTEERRKWMEHILGVLNEIYQVALPLAHLYLVVPDSHECTHEMMHFSCTPEIHTRAMVFGCIRLCAYDIDRRIPLGGWVSHPPRDILRSTWWESSKSLLLVGRS